MDGPVISSWTHAKRHNPSEPALLEVPGEWVGALTALLKLSVEHRHNGLLVTKNPQQRQAAKAGIARGDVLLRYNGVELDRVRTLRALAKKYARPEHGPEAVTIEASRGSDEISFKLSGGNLGITVSELLYRLNPSNFWDEKPAGRLRGRGMMWRPL
jgi:S1-C subfamily serine protease